MIVALERVVARLITRDFLKENLTHHHHPKIHLDISIDFSLGSAPKKQKLNSLLESYQSLFWNVYPPEYIIADKLHALISREGTSTRAKDIYDLSILLPSIQNTPKLMKALDYTFKNLQTVLPGSLYQEVFSYDTTLLKRVWKKIQFHQSTDFQRSWDILLDQLKRLDKSPP